MVNDVALAGFDLSGDGYRCRCRFVFFHMNHDIDLDNETGFTMAVDCELTSD